ncbi:hypothetical protein PG999_005433 [Apiospora kogelbergensis]|uniref:Rhodopsin domain-containing protein n=1 Tax=Apiospora kogelbergensis TaxID=1337665 RepID=A0AAW0R2A4_9PEZI
MAMGGDGPWAITVMWALTTATFVFVLLRIYTRLIVVKSFGIDDQVYILAFVFLVCYTAFTTISARYGFGQNVYDLDVEDAVRAVLFEAIGQTFAVLGMAIAKWSLGIFLLRIVMKNSHKWAIWIAMIALMGASISTCFVFWLQCTPPAYLWDRRIKGYCHLDSTPVSMTLCIICVVVDFFFALFPWLFIWQLNMESREKIMILISMSLGVIAGACGIKRTLEVPELSSKNYLKDTVGLIVWSAAEIAVTMICIGIPVCRPLYKSFLTRLTSSDASKYKKRIEERDVFAMHTFGGSTLKPLDGTTLDSSAGRDGPCDGDVKAKVRGAFNQPYITGGRTGTGNTSEESILGRSSSHNKKISPHGILVTEEYEVTRQAKSRG